MTYLKMLTALFLLSSLSFSLPSFAGTHSYVEQGVWKSKELKGFDSWNGRYDLDAQIERCKELKAQGKILQLIVGHGNTPVMPLALNLTDPQVVYVFAAAEAWKFAPHAAGIALWMNPESPSHWAALQASLPAGIFSEIAVDRPSTRLIPVYKGLLSAGGKLVPIPYAPLPESESTEGGSLQGGWTSSSEGSSYENVYGNGFGSSYLQITKAPPATLSSLLSSQTYQDLFFRPWEKALYQGNAKEAAAVATKLETEIIYGFNHLTGTNTALNEGLYRPSQHAKLLEDSERFTEEYFRTFYKEASQLEEEVATNIQKLEEYGKRFTQKTEALQEKEENGPTLFEEKTKELAHWTELAQKREIEYGEDLRFAREELANLAPEKASLDEKMKQFYALRQTALDAQQYELVDQIHENYSGLFEEERKFRTSYRAIEERIQYLEEMIATPKRWVTSIAKEVEEAKGKGSLKDYEIAEMKTRWALATEHREDTEKKIAHQQARLAFFKQYPEFFITPHRDAHLLIGLEDLERRFEEEDDFNMNFGQGVVVGVFDIFEEGLQTSSIMEQVINPEFKSSGGNARLGGQDSGSHGLHVAGIVASNKRVTSKLWRKLGVAPQAKLYLMDRRSVTPDKRERGLLASGSSPTWDVDHTIHYLEMCGKILAQQEVPNLEFWNFNLDFERDDLAKWETSPMVSSPARVVNLSLGFAKLERFSRGGYSSPELSPYLMAGFVSAIQKGKLLVFALGNDGVYVDTSTQFRTIKALAKSPATKKGILTVVNLRSDGLTIAKSSNQPGDNIDLQLRTLSAPGSDIVSTVKSKATAEAEGAKNEGAAPAVDTEEMSGTSMAAPHVSGAAAIVMSNYPQLTHEQVAEALLKGATPILFDKNGFPFEVQKATAGDIESSKRYSKEQIEQSRRKYGMGRLNVAGALHWAEILSMPEVDNR